MVHYCEAHALLPHDPGQIQGGWNIIYGLITNVKTLILDIGRDWLSAE